MDDGRHLDIFTDGSFCPNTGCSGFGVCLDINRSAYSRHKGRFHSTVRNSLTAELIAVCMGVLHAMETHDLSEFKSITVVTDAPGIREAIKRVSPNQRDLVRLVNAATHIMLEYHIKIRTIKGHQPKHTSRDAFLNHRCDVMAKRVMRQWRDSEFPMMISDTITARRERRIERAQEKAQLKKMAIEIW